MRSLEEHMRRRAGSLRVAGAALAVISACGGPVPRPAADVLTHHNDAARTGAVLAEKHLTPSAVAGGALGRLYDRVVDGEVLAQPLYVSAVPTAGAGPRNLALVATETNWVYAFDVDDLDPDPATPPLFARQIQAAGPVRPAICRETPSQRVGITGTPVVDAATRTMFVVARDAEDHQYYLHALDIAAGLADRRSPVRIAATDPTGIVFDAACQRNRPALLLQDGVVYVAFGSLACDRDCPGGAPYHGWVLGYRAADLTSAGVFCTSPESGHAGIWQAGSGLVGAGGQIFFQTGNGPGPLGDAFVGLRRSATAPGLEMVGRFQPANHETLDRADADLGSGGPVWLPTGALVGGGKNGRYFVVDARTLTLAQKTPRSTPERADGGALGAAGGGPVELEEGFQAFVNSYHADPRAPSCGALVRSAFPTNCDSATVPGCFVAADRYSDGEDCGPNINGGPVVWWPAAPGDALVYQMAGRDFLKAFRYDRARRHLDERPFAISTVRAVEGMSGGAASVSADGDRDGVLWVSLPLGDAQWQNVPGRLIAFEATTLRELWHDDSGYLFSKFTPPTVADGKIIRATASGRIVVYGLRPGSRPGSWWARAARGLSGLFEAPAVRPPPPSGRAAVDEKYRLEGGASGFLGSPESDARPVQDAVGGWCRDFRGVALGVVSSTVAVRPNRAEDRGPGAGRPWSSLGTRFTSSIYWSPRAGAHFLTGEIRDAWLAAGGPGGGFGYPTADEAPDAAGGRVCPFEHGEIRWSPEAGATSRGAIAVPDR